MVLRTVEFWSSVQYGTFLRGLVRELNLIGWNAEQRYLIEEHEYRRSLGYHSSLRFRLRSYLQYPFQLYRRIQEPSRPAVLVVCTNTFYAPAVAMLAARKRGVPVVHWIFDLYPDVLVQLGRMRAGSITERFLAEFTRYALKHAAVNVFLGEDVKRRAEERFGPVPRPALIPVGADGAPFRATRPHPAVRHPIPVLYCGNVGRMHDVDTIIHAIRAGVPDSFTFQFRGKGVGMEKLQRTIADQYGVHLGPSLGDDQWVRAMRANDIALVTFKDDARGLGMPSKTYSAMVAGQAILAIGPLDSDLGQTVLKHDAGWVVPPGEVTRLRALLAHIAAHPAELLQKRQNAFTAGHAFYDQKMIAQKWSELLERVLTQDALTDPAAAVPLEPRTVSP